MNSRQAKVQVCHSSKIQQEDSLRRVIRNSTIALDGRIASEHCSAAAPQLLTGCVERPPLDGRLELMGQGCRKGGTQPHENADDVCCKVLRLHVGMEKVCVSKRAEAMLLRAT